MKRCLACLGEGCIVCHNTGRFVVNGYVDTNERYTPPHIIELARKVMGHIHCDPASSEIANHVVQADIYYTYKDNGLSQPWLGNVWCNPPYGRVAQLVTGLQRLFGEKAIVEFSNGNASQIMMLLNGNAPYRKWYKPLRGYPVCFFEEDVEFGTPNGGMYENPFGSIIVYMGNNRKRFIDVFHHYGYIACECYY